MINTCGFPDGQIYSHDLFFYCILLPQKARFNKSEGNLILSVDGFLVDRKKGKEKEKEANSNKAPLKHCALENPDFMRLLFSFGVKTNQVPWD